MRITKRPAGTIQLPPSKSLSHRALICAALAGGKRVSNVVDNMDIDRTCDCLTALGASFVRSPGTVSFLTPPSAPQEGAVLDCGESGSTLRFFIPLAAVYGIPVKFTGQGRLLSRPMAPYVDCFTPNGVTLEQSEVALTVSGKLTPGTFCLPGDVSSQFVTGLLFALPLLDGDSVIEITTALESASYVDLTLDALAHFGIRIEHENYQKFTVPGNQQYAPADYTVEADYSSAAFLLAAGALGCEVICKGLNPHSSQGDRAFLDVIAQAGGQVDWIAPDTVQVRGGNLQGITVDVSDTPDLVPPMAALLCFCRGTSRIINAARLRMKESDRLHAVATELNRLGAKITEGSDYLEIEGVPHLTGGRCHSHNDHRIAMMAALASLRAQGTVEIDDPTCVNKSYPGFWDDFLKI